MTEEESGKQSFGVRSILRERGRQISTLGYDTEHDKNYTKNTLLSAAYAYIVASMDGENRFTEATDYWPWTACSFRPHQDSLRNLAKAGALIAAAMDKINEE